MPNAGVDRLVAAVLIADIGTDMSVFLSACHLASWSGVYLGNHESAGRQKSGKARSCKLTSANLPIGSFHCTVASYCCSRGRTDGVAKPIL